MKYKSSSKIENEAARLEIMNKLGGEVVQKVLVKIKKDLGSREDIKILDAGCGVGADFKLFKRVFPKSEIIGADASEKSLTKARETGLAKKLVKADLLKLSASSNKTVQPSTNYYQLTTGHFDIIFFKAVLMHINLAPKFLRILAFLSIPGAAKLLLFLGDRGVVKTLKNIKPLLSDRGVVVACEVDYEIMNAKFPQFKIYKKCLINTMQKYGINPFVSQKLPEQFQKAGYKNVAVLKTDWDIETDNPGWKILHMLYEVASKPFEKALKKEGINNMPKILDGARKDPENRLKSPLGRIIIAC